MRVLRLCLVGALALTPCVVALAPAQSENLAQEAERQRKRREEQAKRGAKQAFDSRDLGKAWVGWRSYEPDVGGVTLSMPELPASRAAEEITLYGKILRNTYRAWSKDAVLYSVAIVEHPLRYLNTRPPMSVAWEEGRRLATSESGAELVAVKPLTFAGTPALEFRGERFVAIALLSGQRAYVLTVAAPPDVTPDGREFFDSFRITR